MAKGCGTRKMSKGASVSVSKPMGAKATKGGSGIRKSYSTNIKPQAGK